MYSAGCITIGRIITFCNTGRMCSLSVVSDQSRFSTRDAANEIRLKKVLCFWECNKLCFYVLPALTDLLCSYSDAWCPSALVQVHLLCCSRSPSLLFISPVDLNDVLSLEPAHLFSVDDVYSILYSGWSIILLVKAFLTVIFCLRWSVSVCVSVWGHSGSLTGYCLTFFFPAHAISLISPFRMEYINATGALSIA